MFDFKIHAKKDKNACTILKSMENKCILNFKIHTKKAKMKKIKQIFGCFFGLPPRDFAKKIRKLDIQKKVETFDSKVIFQKK